MTSEQELAYLCGNFDAEGGVCLSKNLPRLEVNMLSPEPIELASKYFGVNVNRPRKNGKLAYQWYAHGKRAVEIAKELMKFSLSKYEQLQVLESRDIGLLEEVRSFLPEIYCVDVVRDFGKNLNAYVGGLIDGDGHISIYRRNLNKPLRFDKRYGKFYRALPNHMLESGLAMVDYRIPYLLQEIYGIGGVSKSRLRSGKQNYFWKVCSNDAVKFLDKVSPFLLCKKEEARIAKDFQINKKPWSKGDKVDEKDVAFRETCAAKMKEIKYMRYNGPHVLL